MQGRKGAVNLCPKCRVGVISVHLDEVGNGATYDWCGPCAAQKLRTCIPKTLRSMHIWAIHAVGETCNEHATVERTERTTDSFWREKEA